MDRTGGGFPNAHVDGTFTYDADAGTAVLTSTAQSSTDPNFDGCVGVAGSYHLAFPDCSHFTLTEISDACAVRVRSMGGGAVLTSGPLPNGATCSASGITGDDAGTSGQTSDGGSDAGPDGGTCTVTLTGGVSKTITSCTVSAVYDGANMNVAIQTPNGGISGVPEFSFAAKIAGVPATGTSYTWSNSVRQSGTVAETTSAIWTMDSAQPKGSSSMQFSTLTAGASSNGNTVYTAHGSLSANYVSTSSNPDTAAAVSF